jgi:hypothetical protein
MTITPAAIAAFARGDLENFVVAATPGGIEAQEAAGQATFCASQILPKDMHGVTREQLEAIGFKFGDDQDDIFVNATLPAGWTKKASDHSMWSYLHDEKGRKRARIFYKAAFYDRRASLRMDSRYSLSSYQDGADKDHYRVAAMDCDTEIHVFGEYARSGGYEDGRALEKDAEEWMLQKYPDFRNNFAYWD